MDPLVSVIIPTRDRPNLLQEALKSLFSQTLRDFEVVVVNDGGCDVRPVLEGLDMERILYLEHRETRGVAAARNTALEHARGRYIAYLDDDDVFYPDHLETLVGFLEGSGYGVAYTDAERLIQKRVDGEYVTIKRDVPWSFDFDPHLILVRNIIWTPSILHERSCLDEVGLFDESLSTCEDWDLWIRMSRRFDFAHIRKVTCAIRRVVDEPDLHKGLDLLRSTERIYRRYRRLAGSRPLIHKVQERVLEHLREVIPSKGKGWGCRITPLRCLKRPERIAKGVSIVIYTPRGEDLDPLLKGLATQRRVDRVEVICVGPGARPVEGVEAVACRRDLSRGEAFNIGANRAKGEFLIFTEEGFIPINHYWLYRMVSPFLEHPGLVALSSRVFPHPRGDAFDRWEADGFGEAFREDSLWAMPQEADGREWRLGEGDAKRRITSFRGVSACVRREVFREMPFSHLQGEDLDYGVRLLEGRKTVGYLASTGVCPLRPKGPVDVLVEAYRRTKLEVDLLREGLSYLYTIKGMGYDELVASILALYQTLHSVLDGYRESPSSLLKDLLDSLTQGPPSCHAVEMQERDGLYRILSRLLCDGGGIRPPQPRRDPVLPELVSSLERFLPYLYSPMERKDPSTVREDLIQSLYKVFALAAGRCLAFFFLEARTLDLLTPPLDRMDALLEGRGR